MYKYTNKNLKKINTMQSVSKHKPVNMYDNKVITLSIIFKAKASR